MTIIPMCIKIYIGRQQQLKIVMKKGIILIR
ncbi:hypothetical protein Athe_0681 [Caldicellulosiruptor bescii DSM 6725]|uniref:Uncharacterized protein n=1 Tax=Caldicellulosiruptor bescii (strain ATCC BAA-1888 / DSM 6725 / KCTC 15123 / Z-1320) TaxID=521460 RepID=B9MQ08_CALBD|nr:hypothetical protein Athe_0681 [Caldicellulosiruptor bescii DSM 6725]